MLRFSTFAYVSHHCFPVDSLFAIFCQCAELVEGGKDEGGRVEKSPVKEKIESTANG